MRGRLSAPIKTSPTPWKQDGFAWRKLARKFINTAAPQLRYETAFPMMDGPLAKKVPKAEASILHGEKRRADNYGYMEDLFDRESLRYVRQEQDHHHRVDGMNDYTFIKHRIWAELDALAVISSRDGGFDKGEERIGDYIYFTRAVDDGSSGEIGFYRKRPGEVDLLAEELINPQSLKQHFGYSSCDVGACRMSQDGKYLAYTISVEGGDRFICHVRSVDDTSLFHVIRSTNIISIEFGANNQMYYTECNELNRPYRVMRQELRPGLLPDPVEIYRDDDETLFVDIRKTKDNAFLVLSSESKDSGVLQLLPSEYPVVPPQYQQFFTQGKPLQVSTQKTWGWLEHHGGHFVMVTTTAENPNGSVVFAREEEVLAQGTDCANWQTLVEGRKDVKITDVDLFNNYLVLFEHCFKFERHAQIRIIDVSKGLAKANDRSKDTVLHFPLLSQLTPGLNKNWDQDTLGFTFSSITSPPRDCAYSFASKLDQKKSSIAAPTSLFTQRQHEIFSPADYMWPYNMYQDFVTGHDGAQVPITICHRRDAFVHEATDFDVKAGSPRPCLLYVYGAYGETPNMHFQLAPFLYLMRRRWTIAFAHVRGGGELPGWAEAGKGRQKMNTVRDFISCCEHLSHAGYTTPQQLVVMGHSAGAVPIASAANMRGNSLFDLALLRSPFLDIINTMADPNLPLSLAECDDWGDPLNNKEDLRYLEQYDPYHNINDRVTYPSMVVSTCLDDDRVPAWNALKYVARLREQRAKQDINPIADPLLLRVQSTGGHFFWNELREQCEELAFISARYDMHGRGSKNDDMDIMDQMSNLYDVGILDHDDARSTWLKWEAFEHEKLDYMTRLEQNKHEPNQRAVPKSGQRFHWDQESERAKMDQQHRQKDSSWSGWASGMGGGK